MKRFALILMMALVMCSVVFAAEDFSEGQNLIQSNVPCSQLTQDQLEEIGDYYMEQMHPGSAHQAMEQRLGGEGSESLRQAHINMALMFYCGSTTTPMMTNTLNTMMGRGGYGMMGNNGGYGYNTGYGMMGNSYGGSFTWAFMIIFWVVVLIALILLIVWLAKQISKK